MDKNFYEILGVEKNATKDEINRVYKKLAMKWHPDRWVSGTEQEKKTAEEKFKEIAEAYSVLSDDQKRQEYDNMGRNPFAGFGFDPFEGFNPFDFNSFGGKKNGGTRQARGADTETEVFISLKEAYNGTKKTITYRKATQCHHCNGSGSADGKYHTCPHCNGTGFITKTQHQGNIFTQTSHVCPVCGGSGKSPSQPCTHCNGTGIEYENITETIDIPRGVQHGMFVTFHGKGSAGKNGGPNGDLIVKISVKNETNLVREGDNLIYYDKVDFVDAILGYEKTIECIDGSHVKINVPELTKDKTSFIFRGKGMPKIDAYGRNLGFGDMAVVVDYIYPTKLTNKHRKLLEDFKKTK